MAEGKGVYKHRNILIVPRNKKWLIYDYSIEVDTITEAKNYIDKKLGGTATKKIPKRLIQ